MAFLSCRHYGLFVKGVVATNFSKYNKSCAKSRRFILNMDITILQSFIVSISFRAFSDCLDSVWKFHYFSE